MARLIVSLAILAAPAAAFSPQGLYSKPRALTSSPRLPARVAPLTSTAAALERPPLAPEDEWIGKLDLEGFRKDVRCVLGCCRE